MSPSGRSLGTPTWEPFLCPTGAGQHCTTSLNWTRQNDRSQECSSAFIAFFLLPWRLWRGLDGRGAAATGPLLPPCAATSYNTTRRGHPMSRATDGRIRAVEHRYQDFHYRTPIKFGGVAIDRATLLDVWCDVETAGGRRARGFGSMSLGNVWSFPSRVLSDEQTLAAMIDPIDR